MVLVRPAQKKPFITGPGSLTGLVLAGGHSSRMGRDKSQLLWQGKPLFQHMVSLLEKSGMDRVLISGSGFGASETASVPDRIPGRGPLSGIHAVLPELDDGDRLVVVPVDMPLLPESALRLLAREHRVCHFRDYSLPLLLVVGDALREAVEQAIESDHPKDYALWRLHQKLDGGMIPLPEPLACAFGNANTPEDWRSCIKQLEDSA